MSSGQSLILGAVLGSLATLIANLLAERVKSRSINNESKKNLRLLLRLEFEGSLKYLDELKNSYNNTDIYALRYTGTLIKSLTTLEGYRSSLYMLQNVELQKKVASLITEFTLFINDIDGAEKLALDDQTNPPEKQAWIEKERRNKQIELIDFRRQLEEIIRDLSE